MTARPLRTTLTAFNTVVLALLLAGLGAMYYRVLAAELDASATANLVEMTNGIHGYLHIVRGTPTLAFDRDDPDEAAFVERATRYYQVYDAGSGRLLVQSPALAPLGVRYTPSEVLAFRRHPAIHDIRTDHGRLRFTNSLIGAEGRVYLLQVAASLEPIDRTLDGFLGLLLWSAPVALLAAGLAGRWMAGRALAPIAALAAAAGTIGVADLGRRLPVRGTSDELDALAGAFNRTLARLEQSVGEMKQFSAALAHELRTPLAALRGETELALLQARTPDEFRQGLAGQLEELDTLAGLVNQLLTLARAEAGEIALARAPVELGGLCGRLVDQLAPIAQARAMTLDVVPGDAPTVVMGDATWLTRLFINVLDNAIKFTPEGGHVTVTVGREGAAARVDVTDSGPGMSADVAARAFDPFFRADPARSPATAGAGLGLSLVRWIAERHQARVSFAPAPGGGSTFTIRLPLAPDEETFIEASSGLQAHPL